MSPVFSAKFSFGIICRHFDVVIVSRRRNDGVNVVDTTGTATAIVLQENKQDRFETGFMDCARTNYETEPVKMIVLDKKGLATLLEGAGQAIG